MKVHEIMTKDPNYIGPNETLQEAARRLKDLNVGMLPVGDGITLKGMITDRDIAIRVVAENLDPKTLRISDIMTPEVLYIYEDQSVDEAVDSMKENQVRRLIVLNREKKLIGIVALADIAKQSESTEQKAQVLEAVS